MRNLFCHLVPCCSSSKRFGFVNHYRYIITGDNFYDDGVANDTDPRFFITYENVYTQQSLQVDWHVVSGNHGQFLVIFILYPNFNYFCRLGRKCICTDCLLK